MTNGMASPVRVDRSRAEWRRIAMVAALLVVAAGLTGCSEPQQQQTAPPAQTEPVPTPDVTQPEAPTGIEDATELKVEDLEVGTGAEAKSGQTVTVHYTGWLADGTKFESSLDSGQPITFQLGGGQVIAGWDEGIAGMKVGGKRRLIIPPDKGYGDQGAGTTIPPKATLVFDVELLGVQ